MKKLWKALQLPSAISFFFFEVWVSLESRFEIGESSETNKKRHRNDVRRNFRKFHELQ